MELTHLNNKTVYKFDRVFSQQVSQEEVYDEVPPHLTCKHISSEPQSVLFGRWNRTRADILKWEIHFHVLLLIIKLILTREIQKKSRYCNP